MEQEMGISKCTYCGLVGEHKPDCPTISEQSMRQYDAGNSDGMSHDVDDRVPTGDTRDHWYKLGLRRGRDFQNGAADYASERRDQYDNDN
jgi:hypothetical protein